MLHFLGVDVGTSSVRVGVFNELGLLVGSTTRQINVFNFKNNYYEQSSDEIFQAICFCINHLVKSFCSSTTNEQKIDLDSIVSIGFDATCSLVVLDENFKPISVSPSGNNSINVIMWMDHRSNQQADFINSTGHHSLKSVGGKISLEMDPPKILWLKENLYEECYSKAAYFFSLPDYLVWRFTSQDIRSVCCTTCKWLFKSSDSKSEWDASFWDQIGLGELSGNNFNKIGSKVEKPFTFIENLKITLEVKSQTGLSENVRVGVSMIDAHAGGIGGLSVTLGHFTKENKQIDMNEVLVLVSGTSSCLMATSNEAKFIDGIWGPYYSAMVPNKWLNEAGQSASGKLIDHLIQIHPAYNDLEKELVKRSKVSIYEVLNEILEEIADEKNLKSSLLSKLTKEINIYPDFHGNRSPLADPQMHGVIYGLSFDKSLKNLALIYLASVQALAYQTKHIIDIMNSHGIIFKVITIIGGLANNILYCQLVSDVCELPVLTTQTNDSSVLLGAAICGASNLNQHQTLSFNKLLAKFSRHESNLRLLMPNLTINQYHKQKFKIYLNMIEDQRKYKHLLEGF